MITNIQYIIDNNGSKLSVILPFSEWQKMKLDYQKLQNKLEVLQGIHESMNEVNEAKGTGEKLQTLTDFLNES